MLEYDNNAFYYFALTFIALYAIPGTYFVSSELYAAYLKPAISDTQARTTLERKKAQHLKSELYGYNRINYPAFWINLVLVCICWLAAFLLVTLVKQDGVVSSFDPYDILEIGREATVQEIKRAYRRLSLKYHPDKNPGDMEAADIFMKIAKAHQALTDPDAMANWKQFGNPDGKQSLEVSIGLPSILVENPKIVLVLYLCSMIIFIPIVVGLWYANSKQYGDKNILYETYSAFYQLLTPEHNHVRVMPELIAASGECRNIISEYMPLSEELGASKSNAPNPHKKEDMAISKLYGSKLSKIMYKPRLEHPSILRSNILMHAHLCRMTDDLPPLVLKILEKILLLVPELVDGIIEIAVQRKWLLSVLSAIYFQQHMVQAISWTISMENSKMPTIGVPLLQFPHLNAKHITSICALIGNKLKAEGGNANNTAGSATSDKQQVKAISKFLELSEEEKFRGLDLNAEQKSDILKACELIPNMFVDFAVFVEEEEGDEENFYLGNVDKSAAAASKNAVKKPKSTKGKKGNSLATLSCPDAIANSNKAIKIEGTDIFEGDLVTIRVVIRRGDDEKKLTKKSRDVIPSVHAPYYPGVLKENLWLIALAEKPKLPPGQRGPPGSEEPAIIACEKLQSQRRYLEKDIKFLAPPKAGEYKFQLRVYSDAYIGLDFMTEASYTVKPASEVPEYEFHEEDLAVDAEPSLFDQLMSTATDSDSDSDSDSDEEVNAVPASDAKVSLETEENMPTAVGKKNMVVVEDSESSDDE